MPVATVFENLELGTSIEEIIERYYVTREQIRAVLEFAARSLDAQPAMTATTDRPDELVEHSAARIGALRSIGDAIDHADRYERVHIPGQ